MTKHTIEVEVTRKETETREVEFPLYFESVSDNDYGDETRTFYRYDAPRRCVSVSIRNSPSIFERAVEIEVDESPGQITASMLDGDNRFYRGRIYAERFDAALAEARKMLDEIAEEV